MFEEKLVQILTAISDNDERRKAGLDFNKAYQERIDTIRTRLWTTLTWLAAAQGAALVLIVKEGGLRTGPGADLVLAQPVLIFLLSSFGGFLAYYMRQVVNDGVAHIRRNFRYSNIVIEVLVSGITARPVSQTRSIIAAEGSPMPAASPESVFGAMKLLAWCAIFIDGVLVVIGVLGFLEWLGCWDFPHIRIAAKTPAATTG